MMTASSERLAGVARFSTGHPKPPAVGPTREHDQQARNRIPIVDDARKRGHSDARKRGHPDRLDGWSCAEPSADQAHQVRIDAEAGLGGGERHLSVQVRTKPQVELSRERALSQRLW